MTPDQSQAVWELRRQGFALQADEAERCWEEGEIYHLAKHMKLSKGIRALIERCNRAVSYSSEHA